MADIGDNNIFKFFSNLFRRRFLSDNFEINLHINESYLWMRVYFFRSIFNSEFLLTVTVNQSITLIYLFLFLYIYYYHHQTAAVLVYHHNSHQTSNRGINMKKLTHLFIYFIALNLQYLIEQFDSFIYLLFISLLYL